MPTSLAQALARDPWFALAHEPQTVRVGGSRAERRAHLPQLLDGTRRVGR